MINDIQMASRVSELFLNINEQLTQSIHEVEDASTHEEFENYRRRVGTLIYSTFEQILIPIYRRHPSLKPPELEI